jgi:hypothetical protein
MTLAKSEVGLRTPGRGADKGNSIGRGRWVSVPTKVSDRMHRASLLRDADFCTGVRVLWTILDPADLVNSRVAPLLTGICARAKRW